MATEPAASDIDDPKKQILAERDARQSPVGFYNLGLSYLDAADDLTSRIHEPDVEKRLRLSFDAPIRHLYAQTWELTLKACLFAQGIEPHKLKKRYGHNLLKAWKRIDRKRFAPLKLEPETENIARHLGHYHTEKMFAYPETGYQLLYPLNHLKAVSQRFRIGRNEIVDLFLSKVAGGDVLVR